MEGGMVTRVGMTVDVGMVGVIVAAFCSYRFVTQTAFHRAFIDATTDVIWLTSMLSPCCMHIDLATCCV